MSRAMSGVPMIVLMAVGIIVAAGMVPERIRHDR